jgi:DNA-binding NtrC family response regulator
VGGADAGTTAALDDGQALGPQLQALQARLERAYFHRVLKHYRGHLQKTAAHAGITRRTLYTKMKELGMDADVYREGAEG